ncbi:muscarinic acetylcholine receptor M4-like [Pleurodeles waltl]
MFIAAVTGTISLVTVVGNILVMLSIKLNVKLQTINNYFLFSLACADLIVGFFSMNLYSIYNITGYWPLGPLVCDLWLALDYVVSNTSVMHLLIISFDRYFCVTKPLTYPVKRTAKMAGLMIASAWILSFVLWAPAILFWQFIDGRRTVPDGTCYIQFLSNPVVTFGTAIAAFYLPIVIMFVLYTHISTASKSRVKRSQQEVKKPKSTNQFFPKISLIEGGYFPDQKMTGMTKIANGNIEDNPFAEKKENSTEPGTLSIMQSAKEKLLCDKEILASNHSPTHQCKNQTFNLLDSKTLIQQTSNEYNTAVKILPANASNASLNRSPSNVACTFATSTQNQIRKKHQVASREKKVIRTIFAILMAFFITWTPYNVMVLINTFCQTCVPEAMWSIGYWLCYINSTINPACYALCNATFKKTFKHLLMFQYRNLCSGS